MPNHPFDRLRGLFEKKSAPTAPVSLTDPYASFLFGGSPTNSGPSVTPESAMRVPAVSAAVKQISQAVGTLPAKVFSRDPKTAAPDHPAYRLIHDEANPWTSAADLRTQLTADALLHDKGGFASAVRVNGVVTELHRLDPRSVTPKFHDDGEPFYEVGRGAGTKTFPFTDILHIPAFGGLSDVTRGREAIALALALEQMAAALFKNGAQTGGVLSYPDKLPPGALDGIKLMWRATHGGAANSGVPAVLENGAKWERNTLSLVDAQFEQLRRFQTEEIARAFLIPTTMLFELSHGTFANTEQMARQFNAVTLKPWLELWQGAYSRLLLPPDDRLTHFVEFIPDDLTSTDSATQATTFAQYRAMGVYTANEVRAIRNMPPITGGDTNENPNTTSGAANNNGKPEGEAA